MGDDAVPVGSVVAATLVNPILLRAGPRLSYLCGLGVFGAAGLVPGYRASRRADAPCRA